MSDTVYKRYDRKYLSSPSADWASPTNDNKTATDERNHDCAKKISLQKTWLQTESNI